MNNKPTDEDYVKAKENISMLNHNIHLSQTRIMKLIDELTREKNSLDTYNRILDDNKNVVMLYEIHEELKDE